MKKILLFLSFLLMSIGMWGADIEFTPSSSGGMSSTAGSISGTKNGITIVISNGVNNGSDIRVYKNASMTITSSVGNITNIAFTYSGSNNGGWSSNYTPNSTSWTSPKASGTQARCTRIVVTYTQSAATYSVTYNLNGGTGTTPTETNKEKDATFDLHNGTIGITPPSCKTFSKWKDQDNNEFNGGATYTMPAKNVTLTAQWVDVLLYTVSFNNAIGENPSSIKQPNCTTGVALPTPTFSSACEDDGWEFAGWSESNSDYSSLKTGTYTPENDTILYAVYKKSSEEGDGFKLSLTYSTEEYYITPRSGSNKYFGASTNSEEAEIFYIDNDTLYIFENSTKMYVSSKADNTSLSFDTSNPTAWTISESSNLWTFTSKGTGGRNLAWNYNQGSPRFSSYTGSNTYLYHFTKHGSGSTEYSFNPSCCEKQVTITKIENPDGSYDLDKTTLCGDAPGGIVNISNILPNDGYEFDQILCVDEDGEETGTIDNVNKRITDITKNCYVVVLFKELPEEPDINVIEWNPDYIKLDIENFDGAITAIIENKNTQSKQEENVATELFFSKYFEASGENKMLAIYNGTKDTIKLDDYRIVRSNKGVSGVNFQSYDLDTLGRIKYGYICPNEEIILAHFNSGSNSADTCAAKQDNYDKWYTTTEGTGIGNVLNFSGPMSIGLYKKSTSKYIDVIGATTSNDGTGDLIQINSSNSTPCNDAINYEYNDGAGFSTLYGDSIGGNSHNYFLSTNRCLLIRKNTVHSGDSAIKYNVYTTQLDCSSDVVNAFVTLKNEWVGYQVGKKSSEEYKLTCEGMAYVGGYNYNEYYAQYTQVGEEITLTNILQSDSTYKIDIEDLDTLSCTLLKIIISDGEERKEKEYKIPIFVTENINSNNTLFTQEGDDCPECDVIITKTGKLVVNSNLQNRDVTVYPGGVLVIPEGKTYHVNSLTLRRENDTVPYFSYKGSLVLDDKFYIDLRTDADDWRWMTLPFAHKVSDITYQNGKKPKYNSELFIEYYDGQYRAENKKDAWKVANINTTFNAGDGFIFGVDLPDKLKKTYRFTYIQDTIEHEKSDKTVKNLFAYGNDNDNLAPNHKGWNLIGNPFMDNDTTDIADNIIGIGKMKRDSVNGHWTGGWVIDEGTTGKLRYAVFPSKDPKDVAACGYKSEVLDDYVLEPFTSFFVQLGGNADDMQTLTFNVDKRLNRIVAKRTVSKDNEELFLRVKVDKWKTGMFISNKFTDEYEPGDDLESYYPIYQSIGGYKLLYSAINDSIIEHGVQITAPSGILYLDEKVNTDKFEYIYVNYNDSWYDLMHGETIELESGNFILQAKRKIDDVATDIFAIPTNGVYKFYNGENIYINRNNTIFDLLGKKIK